MKVIYFFLLFSFTIIAQQENVENKLVNWFNKVDLYYNNYIDHNYILTLNKIEIDSIVAQLYDLYSNHWIETRNFISLKYEDAKKGFEESKGNLFVQLPAVKIRVLKETIDRILGKHFSEIIIVPFYFRVKILQIDNKGVYQSGGRKFGTTILTCEINDIIKGNSFFQNGEKIKITYLRGWGVAPFEVGSEYFIPVKPWNCKEGNCSGYTINLFDNDIYVGSYQYENYQIKNNEIKNASYFGITTSNWNDFLKEFKNKYIIGGVK